MLTMFCGDIVDSLTFATMRRSRTCLPLVRRGLIWIDTIMLKRCQSYYCCEWNTNEVFRCLARVKSWLDFKVYEFAMVKYLKQSMWTSYVHSDVKKSRVQRILIKFLQRWKSNHNYIDGSFQKHHIHATASTCDKKTN